MTARAFLRFSLREAARLAGLRCRLCRAARAEADEPHGDVPALPRHCLSCGVAAGTPCPRDGRACHFAGAPNSAHGFTEGSDM